MKKLLKKHFDQFEEGQNEISPQLLEKIYSLEKEGVRTIKKSFNLKKISLGLVSCMMILAIPISIYLFRKDSEPNPNRDKYVTSVDANNGLLALSRNGNNNIAKVLIMAVDDYKEKNNTKVSTSNHITYLSTRNIPMNSNTTDETESNQENEPLIRYNFSFVDFYDTFEFYVDANLEREFTENFEDTHFRVLISNVDLYSDNMTVWHTESIIVLINQAGQMISYLTNGGSYRPDEVVLEFSNHKWLDGNDVIKDIDVSPHYILTLNTNYKDRFDLSLTQYNTKFTEQTDHFNFNTVQDSYYKVEDRIMLDLNNLVDRVATVTFIEMIDENKFSFQYQGDIYYCLFDESVLDQETVEILSDVNELTIIFDGYFVADSLDTIVAQQITIKSYKPQEPIEETTELEPIEETSGN